MPLSIEDIKTGLTAHALTAALSIGVAYIALQETQSAAEPEYVKVLQDELGDSRDEYNELVANYVELQIRFADLQRISGESPAAVEATAVFTFLDRLSRPAWCKKVVPVGDDDGFPEFHMGHLNIAYAQRYGITRAAYEGKTDFEVWEESLAQAYYSHDLQSWIARDYIEFEEIVTPKGGKRQLRWFSKFWLGLPSSNEYICGIEITPTLQVIQARRAIMDES